MELIDMKQQMFFLQMFGGQLPFAEAICPTTESAELKKGEFTTRVRSL